MYKAGGNSDSDSDSDREEKKDDRTPKEPMKMMPGFLSRWSGIFTDNNEKNDCADEEEDNPIDSNINPTN